jgi:acyl transferase domain-containing protein
VTEAKTVFMFAGQGSQYFQMGRSWFEHDPVFREQMLRMDRVVRDATGSSVVDTLYADRKKSDVLDRTSLTHPAIFMVECALARSLIEAGVHPDLTLGASLGTFAAATVAGCISVEEALAAVLHQAIVFERHCEPGGMFAVLDDPSRYNDGCLAGAAEMAAINFSSHFVIAAPRDQFARIESLLLARGATHQRLPVSFAFHSRWIESARIAFEDGTRSLSLKQGSMPFMCCAEARLVQQPLAGHLWRVVRQPIRFMAAIEELERRDTYRYIDVGPASTLATFLKYGLPKRSRSDVYPLLSPYGQEQKNLAALLATRH